MLLTEITSSKLYHATKLPHYKDQLKHDHVMAAMIHRFWKDGKRRERGQPGYDDHVWIKGLSLSRDLRFCLSWGILIFELDRQKLNQKYKLLPITWFSQNTPDPKGTHIRRESEEFLWIDTSSLKGDGPAVTRYAEKPVYIEDWHKYCTRVIISDFFMFNDTEKVLEQAQQYAKKHDLGFALLDRSGSPVHTDQHLEQAA